MIIPNTASAADRAVATCTARWGTPRHAARAPGRVNLIGEHTDYNDGFTMPMALPFDTVIAAVDEGDPTVGEVVIASEGFGEIAFRPFDDPTRVAGWARHLAGVVNLIGELGVPSGGWRAAVATDIPTGASLSSSAAIEVAAITLLLARGGLSWAPIEIARLGQRVENEVVGVPSGIMDQFISAGAIDGHVSLMDCRALTLEPRRLPAGVVVAVVDTGTRRVLADVAYGERRAACQRAVAELGVAALRDVTVADLARIEDAIVRRRAHHVVTENERTLAAADSLDRGDVDHFGSLMNASHVSLRDEFEVSGPGLDQAVEIAQHSPGCLGARMTGGGFAGCAVALVAADRIDEFTTAVVDRYQYDGLTAKVWACRPSHGAASLI